MFFGIELSLALVCNIVVLGRIVDMSLATIRTVVSVKGKPQIAALIGFFEAFFWFIVVKAALDYIIVNPVSDTLFLAFAYSLGFALGTFLGGLVTSAFVNSKIHVQVVLSKKDDELINILKDQGYGQTIITAKGAKKNSETYMIFIETDSKKMKNLKEVILSKDPKAFVSVSESKSVVNGYYGYKTTRK